jgi:phage repressor protein C with HTH and peptisase S24 domain
MAKLIERLKQYIDTKGVTAHAFEVSIGMSNGNFGKALTNGSPVKSDFLESILTQYPDINPAWLLTGKGSMLLTDTSVPSEAPATKATSPSEGIPLIPFSAMAGALAGEQTALDYECERYVVPAFKNADFLMRVQGVSMQPTYLSGDIVACQRVPLSDIFFQWNKTYVLDTSQGALIKRVKPGKDDHHILIVSDNTQYDPFELSRTSIHAIALVIGLIRLE